MRDIVEGFRQAWGLIAGGDAEFWGIVLLSLQVSGLSVAIGAAVGVPAGALLALGRFRGRQLLLNAVYTLMGLPPVVAGLIIYLLFSHSGPLGFLHWLFTPAAMVVAQTCLAAPIITGLTAVAVGSLDDNVRLTALGLGASRWQVLAAMISEARYAIVGALVSGLGRAMAEVGAVMMVGGNIRWETRVMTTAIVLQTGQGNYSMAIALGLVLLGVAFVLNTGMLVLQRAGEGVRRV